MTAELPGSVGWRRRRSGQLFSIIGFSCFYSFLPLFFQTIGVNSIGEAAIWAGAATFSQAIMVAIFSPIWGGMADRYGGKLMVLRALFGAGIIFIVLSMVLHAWQVVALFLVLGCLTGVNTAIVTMVSAITPRERMGTAIGICQTCVFVGSSIGPAIGGVLADALSYRASIRAGAVFMVVAGSIVLFGVNEPRRTPTQTTRRAGLFAAFRPGALSRSLVLLIAMIFLVQFSLQMVSPVLPLFIQQLSHSSARVATLVGIVLGASGVASAIGAITCGRAADRFGRSARPPLAHRRGSTEPVVAGCRNEHRATRGAARILRPLHGRTRRAVRTPRSANSPLSRDGAQPSASRAAPSRWGMPLARCSVACSRQQWGHGRCLVSRPYSSGSAGSSSSRSPGRKRAKPWGSLSRYRLATYPSGISLLRAISS